jgi:cyclic beta-1,2-glucan synthetase
VNVDLEPGQSTELIFLLGECENVDAMRALVSRYAESQAVENALSEVRDSWQRRLTTLEVRTPSPSVDFLLNRWLLWQALGCRIWGRSALYQSSGAFGFRDQLQDSLALLYAQPDLTRTQILRCAARQFREGDVQHWWHADTGNGVRTQCSDDLIWLPYATARYVEVTGDASILDEDLPFLEAPELKPGEHEVMSIPGVAPETATLAEHCRRALDRGWRLGAHGLPLIGIGDWNDGLNRVGIEGRGESVWLAWFLCATLRCFAATIENRMPEREWAPVMRGRAAALVAATNRTAWDGAWYLRGFFDDGSPLGSRVCEEARIDSLPQSWAVLAGGAPPLRARTAMESANRLLIDERNRLVRLFTPPFDHSLPHPGYIMGYPPGVRENGGQYTHGSLWLAAAWARLGNGDAATRLVMMMNPVESSRTPELAARYRAEPYVTSADVSSAAGHEGQAGWTWYTGSAGLMYRIWIEEVLGFQLAGDKLTIRPALPSDWEGFEIRFRYRTATYEISVRRGDAAAEPIHLVDDGAIHQVTVWIPRKKAPPEVAPHAEEHVLTSQ